MKIKKMLTKKKIRKVMFFTSILSMYINMVTPVYAEDPLSVINNLSNFIFSLTRAIGTIILVFGLIQIGLSYQSHDPSQRTSGVFTLVGGIIIAFSKEIIDIIIG